jgi:hypothetical protein
MFSFKLFQDYLKYLCEINIDISHGQDGRQTFFRMDDFEQSFATGGMAGSPYVCLDDAMGYPIDEDLSALEWSVAIHFLSTVNVAEGNIADKVEQARETTFDIMFDFYLRIINDFENQAGCDGITYMNSQQMEFAPMGPEKKSDYGWLLKFTFRTPVSKYNNRKWRA